jgi:hypothetical protein
LIHEKLESVDAVVLCILFIVAELVGYKCTEQNKGGKSNGKVREDDKVQNFIPCDPSQ